MPLTMRDRGVKLILAGKNYIPEPTSNMILADSEFIATITLRNNNKISLDF